MCSSYANWQWSKSRYYEVSVVSPPHSRDSRLDLSRLNPGRASFCIWTLSFSLVSLAFLYVSFAPFCHSLGLSFSLYLSLLRSFSPSLAIFHLSYLPCVKDKVLRTLSKGTSIDEYVRVTTARYENKRMHALVQTRSQGCR